MWQPGTLLKGSDNLHTAYDDFYERFLPVNTTSRVYSLLCKNHVLLILSQEHDVATECNLGVLFGTVLINGEIITLTNFDVLLTFLEKISS